MIFELPDPPENADFLDLPEDFQDRVCEQFDQGTALTAARDNHAHQEWLAQVHVMRSKREHFAQTQNETRRARLVRERANKASLGEFIAAHRAENSGSAK